MNEGQKDIFFVTGESKSQVYQSHFFEQLKKRGYKVLYMIDQIDEYLIQKLNEYYGKKSKMCIKKGLDLEQSQEKKKAFEENKASFEALCKMIKEVFGDKIKKVLVRR
jgi:molecular chaperone HtpG